MSEFGDIWKSYIKGEPLSKLVTESHHAEGDDENEDINMEEYEYVYIDEDGNEIDNYQEEGTQGSTDDLTDEEKLKLAAYAAKKGKGPLAKESDESDDEDLEVAEESDDEPTPEDWEAAEEQDKEQSDHSEAQKMATAEAKDKADLERSLREADTPQTQDLHENLRLLQQENARLKEDLTFVVRKLRNAGLLED